MASILIWGGTKQARKESALNLLSERKIKQGGGIISAGENKEKIGIKEVKALLPHLHIRALARKWRRGEKQDSHIRNKNNQRGVLFLEAQRLTVSAQNALLKILEEPPASITFILTTPHPKLLLPTIVSRCAVKPLLSSDEDKNLKEFPVEKVLKASGEKRVVVFEDEVGYAKENILAFLDASEACLRKETNQKNAQMLKGLWKAKKLLRSESANPKLIVDELLLSW
jgi:DNA polymerase III delta prime subunit